MKRWSFAAAFTVAIVLLFLLLHAPVPTPKPSRDTQDSPAIEAVFRQHVPQKTAESEPSDAVSPGTPPEAQDSAAPPEAERQPAEVAKESEPPSDSRPDPNEDPKEEQEVDVARAQPEEPPTETEEGDHEEKPSEVTEDPAVDSLVTEDTDSDSSKSVEKEPDDAERKGEVAREDENVTADAAEEAVTRADESREPTHDDVLLDALAKAEEMFARGSEATGSTQPRERSAATEKSDSTDSNERVLERSVDELTRLFATDTAAAPKTPGETAKTPRSAVDEALVKDLETLFTEPEQPPQTNREATSATPTRRPASAAADLQKAPSDLSEWEARQEALRALVKKETSDKVRAVFRLERQDPETFLAVARQYRMAVLLAYPAEGAYALVPAGGSLRDKTDHSDKGARLRELYGLAIEHLDFPWVRKLKEGYTATRLTPAELIVASLLIPKGEARAILGRIVADCNAVGVSIDDVAECYGTFERTAVGLDSVFDYRVTRIVLKDGRKLFTNRSHRRSDSSVTEV